MLTSLLGFVELGGIVAAWLIIINFVTKGIAVRHSDKPWASALGTLLHA